MTSATHRLLGTFRSNSATPAEAALNFLAATRLHRIAYPCGHFSGRSP